MVLAHNRLLNCPIPEKSFFGMNQKKGLILMALLDKTLARNLYLKGDIPEWIYIQLYATPEETAEILEKQRQSMIYKAHSNRQQNPDLEKQVKEALSTAITEALKDFKH